MRSRAESTRSIMAELPLLVNAIESAVAKGAAELGDAEDRLRSSLGEVGAKILAEAKERSAETAGLAAALKNLRTDSDAEIKARELADNHLAQTLAALDATVASNEARSAGAREANADSFASMRASADKETADTRERFKKLTETLEQEKQARLALDKDLRAWTDGVVRAAVWDEKEGRSDADKALSDRWNKALADLGSALRAEAQERGATVHDEQVRLNAVQTAAETAHTRQADAAAASREKLASTLRQVEAAVAALEKLASTLRQVEAAVA